MNVQEVWRTLNGKRPSMDKVSDLVNISKHKRVFEESYLPNWSVETFTVAQRLQHHRSKRCASRSLASLERLAQEIGYLDSCTTIALYTMIQDNDFYLTLPSNASTNLFPTNIKSHYQVALARQIQFKDEDWKVGLHHVVHPLSWFDVPQECKHSHILLHCSNAFKLFTLPDGKYQTALDGFKGMLQCLNNVAPSFYYEAMWMRNGISP